MFGHHNPHHRHTNPSSSTTGHTGTVTTTTTTTAEVSIYWDYENLPLKYGAKPTDASKAIVEAAAPFGRIVARRLYADMSRYQVSNSSSNCWSALDSSGFDLVNTPRRNQKETVDKKMIADIFTSAWDSATRGHCKPVVILLTGDGDFAYTLSKLRDRGVMSIVIHGDEENVANVLKASADIAMSFETDVMGRAAAKRNQAMTSTTVGGGNNNGGGNYTSAALLLCKLVLKEVAKSSSADDWLLGSKLAVAFHTNTKHNHNTIGGGDDPKEKYRRARDLAIQKGWLIKGRRSLVEGGNKGEIVSLSKNTAGNNHPNLSMEDFYRVSIQGKLELEAGPAATNATSNNTYSYNNGNSNNIGNNAKLFIKNIPSNVRINDLVQFLENEYKVVVMRGNTLKGPNPKAPFMFGRVQLNSWNDAERLVSQSQSSNGVKLGGRSLEFNHDKSDKSSYVHPEHEYVRPKSLTAALASPKADLVSTLCRVVHAQAIKQGPEGHPDGWVDGGGVAVQFRSLVLGQEALSDKEKDPFKIARAVAIDKQLLQVGRRVKLLDRSGGIEVVSQRDSNSGRYTAELYLRLKEGGRRIAYQASSPKPSSLLNALATSKPTGLVNVFVKGIPADTNVKNLVDFFEAKHNCRVQRASIDEAIRWEVTCTAHVEFTCMEDAAHILKLGSSSDGLLFQGKSLAVLADECIPTNPEDDPLRFYESPLPVTVVQSADSISLVSEKSSMQPVDEVLKYDDPTIFCRVLYEMPSSMIGDCSSELSICVQWKHTGSVGEKFQNIIKGTTTDPKERFRGARVHVINEGLVEFGRRDVTTNEVVLAPFFGGQSTAPNLSKETYLRLTKKGLILAEKGPTLNLDSQKVQGVPASSSPNIYLSNLPTNVQVHEIVDFLEQTFEVTVRRACLRAVHALYASAHIELGNMRECTAIMAAKNNTMIYGGRALRLYIDRNIPDWTNPPSLLYENIADACTATTKEETEVSADDPKANAASSYEEDDPDQGMGTVEYITEEKKTDETDSEVGNEISDSAPPSPPRKVETLATTDLLFGDNLALLYAQCAPAMSTKADDQSVATTYTVSGETETEKETESGEDEIESNDLSAEKRAESPDATVATTPATPLHELPDLLWD